MANQLTDEQKQILADANKNEQEILDEILDKFAELEEAVEDVMDGILNPLIVKGPPGVGKSKGIEIASKQFGVKSTDLISSTFTPWTKQEREDMGIGAYPWRCDYEEKINGALMRGADYGLWQLVTDLYANREDGVLCMDDNDEILRDPTVMALLQKATEQEKTNVIAYGKAASTQELQLRGVPARFETRCPVIILSNIDFHKHITHARYKESQSGKPVPGYIARWEALMESRGKYIDLAMNSPQRVRIYCEHLVKTTKMLENSEWLESRFGRALTAKQADQVIKWVRHNQPNLKTRLDLRTYNKVAAKLLRRQKNWQESARIDLVKVA